MEPLLKTKEVAEVFGIPPWAVLRLVRRGKLGAYRITPRLIRFDPDEVQRYIKDQEGRDGGIEI